MSLTVRGKVRIWPEAIYYRASTPNLRIYIIKSYLILKSTLEDILLLCLQIIVYFLS